MELDDFIIGPQSDEFEFDFLENSWYNIIERCGEDKLDKSLAS